MNDEIKCESYLTINPSNHPRMSNRMATQSRFASSDNSNKRGSVNGAKERHISRRRASTQRRSRKIQKQPSRISTTTRLSTRRRRHKKREFKKTSHSALPSTATTTTTTTTSESAAGLHSVIQQVASYMNTKPQFITGPVSLTDWTSPSGKRRVYIAGNDPTHVVCCKTFGRMAVFSPVEDGSNVPTHDHQHGDHGYYACRRHTADCLGGCIRIGPPSPQEQSPTPPSSSCASSWNRRKRQQQWQQYQQWLA